MESVISIDSTTRQGFYRVEYHPQLIEEAVLRTIIGRPEEKLFREERDRVYELADAEKREEAFHQLHEYWFNHLSLGEPIRQVFAWWPILTASTSRCLFIKARSHKEIGADLYVVPEERDQHKPGISPSSKSRACPELVEEADSELVRRRRTLIVQVTPELLCQSAQLLHFLRREMLHIVDMLDPDFGYKPDFPQSSAGPTYDRFLQGRYRVLWDITVEGRLYQKGWLPPGGKEALWTLFKRTFSGPEAELEALFSYFFDKSPHTHQELMAFAQNPEKWWTGTTTEISSKGRCGLCRFPSFHLVNPSDLSADLLAQIHREHPAWNPKEPICLQCVDLYRVRI